MELWHAIVLGIVEGITEFLPVSSTGHLTIVEKMFGYRLDDPSLTAFTAIIQIGAILAAVSYFRKDISRVAGAWLKGLVTVRARKGKDYAFGWAIILGSLPIAVIGLVFKHDIETVLRSLWFVAISLILWSGVMWYADRHASQKRNEQTTRVKDTVMIGFAQCIALIPGVSRSGATMSAGLLLGFDRVTATRLAFFLGIPALLAAGLLEAVTLSHHISEPGGVGWLATGVATLVSGIVAYVSIAWLLKFVARHDYSVFIWYRVIIGIVLIALLATNTIAAT